MLIVRLINTIHYFSEVIGDYELEAEWGTQEK